MEPRTSDLRAAKLFAADLGSAMRQWAHTATVEQLRTLLEMKEALTADVNRHQQRAFSEGMAVASHEVPGVGE